MGLSFLVPAFLLGLAALAIPIWVHLRNRPKRDTVDFPSLMFLEQIPYRAVQKQQLRHRVLFALRCVALALLALAFARPFLGAFEPGGTASAGSREVVIAVDRSWSMGYGDHWDRAVGRVGQLLDELDPGDRASLVLFDREAEVRVESAADPAPLRAALASAGPGEGTTDLAAGLRAAREILAASELPAREVVLVSDFQRAGWDSGSDVEMPEGTTVRPVRIGDGSPGNVSVAGVNLDRGLDDQGGETVAVTARLARVGEGDLVVQAALEIDGEEIQRVPVEISGNDAAVVSFEPVALVSGAAVGAVRIDRDALPGDDVFWFQVTRGQALSVLVLDHPRSGAPDSLFLRRALGIGSQPAFRVEQALLGDLDSAALADRDLVVLNDPGPVDAGTAATLGGWVADGGGLLVALGEMTEDLGGLGGEQGLLPFRTRVVDREADLGGTLAYTDGDHPVFEVFAAPGSGDLSAARFFRYHALEGDDAEGVLARFDDSAPALVERRVGEGRVLVWTSTLDNFWTDFPLQPIFLPFVQRVARHAADFREPRPWLDAGRPWTANDLLASAGASLDDARALAVGGRTVPEEGGVRLQPGLHPLSWRQGGTARNATVAVNLERVESDLVAVDPEEVAAAVVWRRGGSVQEEEEITPVEQVERAQSIWWYLVVLALILLLAETVLSNRLSPRRS